MYRKTQDVHIVQKDLIVFRKFVKSVKKDGQVRYDKPFTDKSNIKKYLFTGYKSRTIRRMPSTVTRRGSSPSSWRRIRT